MYQLIVPNKYKEVLILYPSFGGTTATVKKSSQLVEKALDAQIAVIILKWNSYLFLNLQEQEEIGNLLYTILEKMDAVKKDIYIGGFSSGGNLAMQTGRCLTSMRQAELAVKGVLIVDSPLDLVQFYRNCQKIIKDTNTSEARYLLHYLERKLGTPQLGLEHYKIFSPCINEIDYVENCKFKNTELVFYTEPARAFKKKNYSQDFEDTNSFQLQLLWKTLSNLDFKVSYIETVNKGYRIGGIRAPHSWSIIDVDAIIGWIKYKKKPPSNILK
ncbi:MAG: hypothetical protein JKY08_04225 [Flavobacteriaceae bacterium]|nr:hypothetical protein [Flavobacteriaceae bacterium]